MIYIYGDLCPHTSRTCVKLCCQSSFSCCEINVSDITGWTRNEKPDFHPLLLSSFITHHLRLARVELKESPRTSQKATSSSTLS